MDSQNQFLSKRLKLSQMRKHLLSLMLVLFTYVVHAQQNTQLKGIVKGSKNEVLAGATVLYVAGGKAVSTDDAGNFTLNALPLQKVTIQVSYTGFTTLSQEVDLSKGAVSDIVFTLKADPLSLNEVVVTGTSGSRTKLASSVSVSTLKYDDATKSAPRTTAEIFRSIPGIKSEASAGDGNTNITVRGIPISAGGSKYLQLQEDGLPVLQFGDIAFGTADIFLRADQSIGRIEAIRGGSASTLATNSPAGIINFISKTGNTEGGAVALTSGLDYNTTRTDFNYGAAIGEGLNFHVGGFYRLGEGPRTAGYNANNGGQLKMNFTKTFKSGYARLYLKYLNDRAAAYMPMPIQVTGTNANPTYTSLPGFDAKYGTMHSPYLQQNLGLGVNGELRRADVADGMHPVSKSVGAEFVFDLGNNWSVENRARFSANNGRFIAPFPAQVGSRASILAAVASATGANLTNASLRDAVTGAAYTGTNAMIVHMFDTELNNFNNTVNDLKLKKKFKNGNLLLGYYRSFQNVSMSWLWNSYVTDVNGNGSKPLNVVTAANQVISQNGLFAYGVPVWGNCCQRNYDLKYDIAAPYAAINLDASDKLNIEASVRWDMGNVRGNYAGSVQRSFDVNNDGTISANEQSVSAVDHANAKPVNYDYDYLSYSIGANYKFDNTQAVFARFSTGAVAKADRLLFTPNVFADGSARGVKDDITQLEIGYKSNFKRGAIFVTGFYANINEAGSYEATTQRVIENKYKSLGIELEAYYSFTNQFSVRGSATYTKAELTDGANKGKKPRRQAPFIYTLMPTYNTGKLSTGISLIGTTGSYAQDDNQLKFKGYVMVNPFVTMRFTKALTATINANNLLNTLGITESEEGAIVNNTTNIIRARSITGRTVSATIAFSF